MSWSPNTEATEGRRRKGPRVGGDGPQPATFKTVFDVAFLSSLQGGLLAVQMVCTFLGMVLAGAWRGSYSAGHGFFIVVMVAAWLCSTFLYVARAIRLDDLLLRNVDWNIVFGFYSAPAALLVLVASCVMVEAAKAVSALKAAGVFGLFAWTALLASALLYARPLWRLWKKQPPTATATVTPGVVKDGGEGGDGEVVSSDEWSDDDGPAGSAAAEEDAGASVTLTQATLRPPSLHFSASPISQSSLYPVDIAGSNRASLQRPESGHSATSGSWAPGRLCL